MFDIFPGIYENSDLLGRAAPIGRSSNGDSRNRGDFLNSHLPGVANHKQKGANMRSIYTMSVMLLVLVTGAAFSAEKAVSLKQNMKLMKVHFAQIKADVGNPAKNASSIVAAEALLAIYKATLAQAGDGVGNFPSTQKTSAMAEYKKITQIGVDDTTALIKALKESKNDLAVRLVDNMKKIETEGHDKFK